MDISELKKELLEGKTRPLYVFTGDELALQDIYVDKICEVAQKPKQVISGLSTIYAKLGAKSFIKPEPKVYVIRNDEDYHKMEKVWPGLLSGKRQKDNIIIFKYTGLDKRGKFLKEHESVTTQFDFISHNLLRNRVEALTKWPIQYCDDLVSMCGCNYGRIKNELHKLQTLADANHYNLQIAYIEAKKANMIHQDIGDVIFDFTNAVIERNIPVAYKYYKQVTQTEDGPLRLVTVLYNSFRNILLVQSTHQKDRTEQVLGLTKGQIYVTSQKCDRYTLHEIVAILKLLQKCESGIKTGLVDVNFVMEYLLAEIF